MKFLVIILLVIAPQALGVIYRLNATEYARLPALFALDRYTHCLVAPGDTYCYLDAKLVANETSELLNVIEEYSAYNKTHFDHTLLHRGVCVKETCGEFLNNSTDLDDSIEACLNASLYRSHGLQTKVINKSVLCTKYGESMQLDAGDYTVAAVILCVLLLNVAGSVYDWFFHTRSTTDGSDGTGARLLLCFSARRNWRRLRMPSGEGPDPRLRQLKCLTGFKSITTFLVVLAHSPLYLLKGTSSPEYLEYAYYNFFMTFLFNGPQLIQTFFIISGFLLGYNMLIIGEKRNITWKMLPQGVTLRWLRLVPVHAMVLGFVSTWQRHIGSGPLWKPVVEAETLQCRRDWYYNLLYVNNYVDNSDCMAHTWYLGADMQLSILGLVIFCLATSEKARKICISLAIVVGMLLPAVHTYFQNLSPVLLISPEAGRNDFVTDPTFNNLYKRGHNNLISYAIGMAIAMALYHVQKNSNMEQFKKYRLLYWASIPAIILFIMTGTVLYTDGFQISPVVRAVYNCVMKLLFGVGLATIIGGTLLRIDTVYLAMLEWRAWAPLSRLAYAAYLVHLSVIRITIGADHNLAHNNLYLLLSSFLSALCLSFLIAVPLWMMVEAPFGELIKVTMGNKLHKDANLEKNIASISKPSLGESKETIEIKL